MFLLGTVLDNPKEPEISTQDDITPTNSDDEERASKGTSGVFDLLEENQEFEEADAADQTHEKLLEMISCQPKVCSSFMVQC